MFPSFNDNHDEVWIPGFNVNKEMFFENMAPAVLSNMLLKLLVSSLAIRCKWCMITIYYCIKWDI